MLFLLVPKVDVQKAKVQHGDDDDDDDDRDMDRRFGLTYLGGVADDLPVEVVVVVVVVSVHEHGSIE